MLLKSITLTDRRVTIIVLAIFANLNLLFIRGFFLAELGYNTVIGSIVSIGLVIIFRLFVVRSDSKFFFRLIIPFLITILFVYLQSFLANSETVEIVVKNVISLVIPVFCYTMLLSNQEFRKYFVFTFVVFISFFPLSHLFTIILYYTTGNLIEIARIDYDYQSNLYIFFPFSSNYGYPVRFGIFLPRMLSLFRESGIAQMMYAFFFIIVDAYDFKYRKWLKSSLFLGIILTLSSSALISIGLIVFYKILKTRSTELKITMLALAIPLGIFAILYIPVIGFKSKSEGFSSGSFSSRAYFLNASLAHFSEHPFGGSIFQTYDEKNKVIETSNLVTAVLISGIPIGFIIIFNLLKFLFVTKPKRFLVRYFAFGIFFMTALTSQPLHLMPLSFVFLILLADT